MSRWLNGSDEEVWDFIHHKAVKPGESFTIPDEDDEAYENHPIWQAVADLGKQQQRKPVGDDADDNKEE
jgi:hypothetical protein